LSGLIDVIPDSKKFSLSRSDINYMIESLDDGIIMDVDISNQSSYLMIEQLEEY